MKNNRKVLYGLVALALLLSVVGISIGFAALSQDLVIEGNAEVVPATWQIEFENLGTALLEGGATQLSTPQLTATKIDNIDVQLTKPGDSVTYTFDVANNGDIDAKFSTLTIVPATFIGQDPTTKTADETAVAAGFEYTVTYADGSEIEKDDELLHGTSANLKLTISYKTTAETIPTNKVEVSGLSATLTYVQK